MAARRARHRWVATCVVLILASDRYAPASPILEWEVFNKVVESTADATVSRSTINTAAAGKKQELAEVVLKSIQGNAEPYSGFLMSTFGVDFAAVVWGADIPPNLQGIFEIGEGGQITTAPNIRIAKRGTVTSDGCSSGALHLERPVGVFGLPCKTGFSILIEQTTRAGAAVNCLVIYTYRSTAINQKHMQMMFDEALATSQQEEPRLRDPNPALGAKVDLTRTVACFHRRASDIARRLKGGRRIFTGAAVIPAAEPENRADVSDYVGLACPSGGMFMRQVPVVDIDLNLLPDHRSRFSFYAIAFAPLPQ